MLSMVFNFCYYATFVIVPLVVFLLINDDEVFHSKGGFLYLVKLIFGKRAIKKASQKVKILKTRQEMEKCELPKPTKLESKSESLTFTSTDQEGNQLSLKITVRADHISESTICLRLGENTYVSPHDGGVSRKYNSGNQWTCQGLIVEILEPFKRCRIIFNGFLKNIRENKVEHVSFRLIWNCCSKPFFSMVDEDQTLLSKCLAKTTWRDGNWIQLLGDEQRVVQFGALRGIIQRHNFSETRVNMACVKIKAEGTAETENFDKYLNIFAATENGCLVQIGIKSVRNGCPELKYGHVLTHMGSIVPIRNSDLDINKIEKSISNRMTVHVELPNKTLKIVVTIKKNSCHETTYDNFKGFKNKNLTSECTINKYRGFAVLDYWTSHQGNGVKRPGPLLRELKVDTIPDVVTTQIGSETSKILELTGGKGNSLSLMKSLENEEILIPEGFIVTTEAFNKQIEQNFNLRKSIALLEDIALGKEKGDLQNACEITEELFRDHIITPTISQKIADELMKFRRKHDDKVVPFLRWAVRSSGIGEDSENSSSAGQNMTFLGSQTDKDVLAKICKCWGSLYSYQSVMYRKQHGQPIRSTMAVVVQQMIPADVSGVLFTCHPTSSDSSKMVMTSNFGLGETVVSGASEPDTIILNKTFEGEVSLESVVLGSKEHCLLMGRYGIHKQSSSDRGGCQSLRKEQALKLGRVGVIIERAFGGPRDIEWAFFKDQLYILQSRPVTTSNQWTDEELTHEFDSPHLSDDTFYTRANIGEVSPFAMTALTYSSLMDSVEKGFQLLMFGSYDPFVPITFRYNRHFCFIELLAGFYVKPKKKIDAFNQMVDLAVFGRPVLTEEINRKAIARYGVSPPASVLTETWQLFNKNWNSVDDIVREEQNLLIGIEKNDSAVEMFDKIDKALVRMTYINLKHCLVSGLSIEYQYFVMKRLLGGQKEIKVENYNDLALILSSCGDVISADVPARLQEMTAAIRKCNLAERFQGIPPEEGLEWLRINCEEVHGMLKEFLEIHGHRLLGEMEVSLNSWAMDPSAVVKMLQVNSQYPPMDKRKKNDTEDIIDKLQSPMSNFTKSLLRFVIKKYRKAVGYREISKSTIIKAANKFRIAYRALGKKMASQGFIPEEDLVYHLTQYELWQILHGKNQGLITKALKRQRLYPSWNKQKFPEVIFGLPEPETENGEDDDLKETDIVCSGTPVCAGEVKARAVVITSLEDTHLLRKGDVLITKSTDIGWSPYFPMLSAVVTELGGLVSHGAVVAREYGLPCIIGAQKATKVFKTEDIVHVSGKKGLVRLLSR